ncbi:MAG: hypothetical protein ACD_60C00007G0007 [uncultured bacterium]|nr:MAG: hypothetical protein ACD_60C00007G0007 [uncultured bacterium]
MQRIEMPLLLNEEEITEAKRYAGLLPGNFTIERTPDNQQGKTLWNCRYDLLIHHPKNISTAADEIETSWNKPSENKEKDKTEIYAIYRELGREKSTELSYFKLNPKLNPANFGETPLLQQVIGNQAGTWYSATRLPINRFSFDQEKIVASLKEASLKEANIKIITESTPRGGIFCLLKYEGGNLLSEIMKNRSSPDREESKWTPETWFHIAANIVDAINEIHQKGVPHGIVNASTFIMNPPSRGVKIFNLDFIRLLMDQEERYEILDDENPYIPPELVLEEPPVYLTPEEQKKQPVYLTPEEQLAKREKIEVYSLGVLLTEILCHCKAILGYDEKLAFSHPKKENHLPPALKELLAAMIDKEQKNRPGLKEVCATFRIAFPREKQISVNPDPKEILKPSPLARLDSSSSVDSISIETKNIPGSPSSHSSGSTTHSPVILSPCLLLPKFSNTPPPPRSPVSPIPMPLFIRRHSLPPLNAQQLLNLETIQLSRKNENSPPPLSFFRPRQLSRSSSNPASPPSPVSKKI